MQLTKKQFADLCSTYRNETRNSYTHKKPSEVFKLTIVENAVKKELVAMLELELFKDSDTVDFEITEDSVLTLISKAFDNDTVHNKDSFKWLVIQMTSLEFAIWFVVHVSKQKELN